MNVRISITLLCAALLGQAKLPAQQGPPRVGAFEQALPEAEETPVRWPVDVAAASSERIGVADAYGPRLFIFTRSDRVWSISRLVDLPAAPSGLAWDGNRFVVSVRQSGGLLALEPLDESPRPVGVPESVVPGPLAATSVGRILVYDLASSDVLEVDNSGRIVQRTPVPGLVTALAAMPSGGFLAALGDEARILKLRPDGEVLASIDLAPDGPVPAWPAGLVSDVSGQFLVSDRHNGRVLLFDSQGTWIGLLGRQGWDPGLLRFPAGLDRLDSDRLVIADQGNGRAQVFTLRSGF